MDNPIKMDDLGVPLFSEASIYTLNQNFPKPFGCMKWLVVLFLCHELDQTWLHMYPG